MHATILLMLTTLSQAPLRGGFIPLNGEVIAEKKAGDYRAVVKEMKRFGMDVLVIQYLGAATDNASPDPPKLLYEQLKVDDPALVILEEAEVPPKMKVFLGLVQSAPDPPGEDTNGRPGYWRDGKLATFAQANVKFAQRVSELYKDKPAFHGWYITLETWVGAYPYEKHAEWARYYEDVSAECRRLKPSLPVAISPMLPGRSDADPNGYIEKNPSQAAKNFFGLLGQAQIDVVMLQDSVGAKPAVWKPDTSAPYLAALRSERPKQSTEIWSNVESFAGTQDPNVAVPSEPKRFESQLAATSGFPRVTFDFFHYMNGVVFLEKWGKGPYAKFDYIGKMKVLHDWYRDTQVKPSNPAPPAHPGSVKG